MAFKFSIIPLEVASRYRDPPHQEVWKEKMVHEHRVY